MTDPKVRDMKKLPIATGALGAVVLSACLVPPAATAAVTSPSIGTSGGAFALRTTLNAVDCFTRKARFSARGTLASLPYGSKNTDVFYLQKEIRWDRSVGSNGYRNIDVRKYDSPRFSTKNLAMITTLADSTVVPGAYLGDSNYSMNLKVTLRKVRRGPDKKIWREERRVWLRGQNCAFGGVA